MITKLSDYKFMTNAGPEICVMSTKVFVSQIAWGYLLAKTVAGQYELGIKNLKTLADKIRKTLKDKNFHQAIKKTSGGLLKDKDIFLLGKSQNLQIVNEGMVKIIEGTYKHAHAMPAGDLKHYAITLMDENVPVVAVLSNDEAQGDMINAISEVKARGARIIGIAPKKLDKFDDWIFVPDTGETSAISNVIPLQLLSYYMTVMLGNDVDKPRNIAKSVTVK
jgi:glucosamine--fructose-6-phosphate aminotransferase (isomerizing)